MSLRHWIHWRTDREFDEELDTHVDLEIQANVERGLRADEARAAALRRLGSRARVKERAREADPFFSVETFIRDVLYGLRNLGRHRGFAAAAIVSLALGIAANTVIFSLVDSTLLKPLALFEPDRLVVLWNVPDQSSPDRVGTSSIPRYVAFKDQARSFESIGAFNGAACGVRTLGFEQDGAPAERILGQTVSRSLFKTLGVAPVMGRLFTDAKDEVDQVAPVILITDRMWERRFNRDPLILGKTVTLNRVRTEVIGVLPAEFDFFGAQVEFIAPLCLTRAQVESRVGGNTIIGRLRPGVSVQKAQSEIDILGGQLAASDPQRHRGVATRIELLQRAHTRLFDGNGQPAGDYRSSLLILQGAVALVLLIACANVAGLLLAQSAGRRHEIALRLALGAGRPRIVRQFLAEGVPLAVIGGMAGLAVSWAALRLFVSTAPSDFPSLERVAVDQRVLGFTVFVVVITSVLSTLVPALQATKGSFVNPPNDTGRTTTAGADRRRLRSVLVTAQIGLTLVLLIGAGLLIRSFVRALQTDLGGDPKNVLTFDFRLPPNETFKLAGRYRGSNIFDVNPAAAQTFARVYERLQAVPGVIAVGATSAPPFAALTMSMPFNIEGRQAPATAAAVGEGVQASTQVANYFAVTPTFFSAMRIPLLEGRDFDVRDTADRLLVMIIKRTMARQYFANENAIGKRVTLDFVPNERPREIIGVVGDTSLGRLEGARMAAVYLPQLQQPPQFAGPFVYTRIGMYFVVRTSGEPMRILPSVKQAVTEIDRNTPVANVSTVEQALDGQVRHLRLYMLLLGAFGVVAALLAATGIYGVMAYSVAERTREIGIRMALGARAGSVLLMVCRQAAAVIGVGTVIGLAGALALTRTIQSALFGVRTTDPATYAAGSLLLLLIAVVACVIPARRATIIDPTVALKCE